MQREKRRFVHLIQVSAFLAAFLASAICPVAASADWADLVKDALHMQQVRTLNGKAFLDHPISGATVRIYDRSGFLLHSVNSATREDGSFSITRELPESFTMVIGGGLMAGEAFDHEVSARIELFDETAYYKVNAVTTLVAAYMSDHPGLSYVDANKAVKAYLCIPESVELREIIYSAEWYCYYFSHYLFMREAKANRGLTAFVGQLVDEVDQGKTHAFYDTDSIASSLFKDALGGLLKGAASELGSEGTGWILGLLNVGGGADTDKRLQEMDDKLDEILSDLSQIKQALQDLLAQLAMDTTKLEQYIQGGNAQDAVTTIKTHFDESGTNSLKFYAGLKAEDADKYKQDMATFVQNINGAWDMQNQVTAIHDAIIPDVGGTKGLLELWTREFMLQGAVGGDQLMNYYKTLERYFAVLLFYQFKGANLVVEAMNYQSSSSQQANSTGLVQAGDESPAYQYIVNTFQPMIKAETDMFLRCVSELILNSCGLFSQGRFLPGQDGYVSIGIAQDILARATFFVIQTLNEDHYGLRAGILGTSNLVNDVLCGGAVDESTHSYSVGVPVELFDEDIVMQNKPYDSWGTFRQPDLMKLTMDTGYNLARFDFGPWDPGSSTKVDFSADPPNCDVYYDIYNAEYAEVKTYTKDYIEDPDGEIVYGYRLGPLRQGGREVIMDKSVFKKDQWTVDKHGKINYGEEDHLDYDGIEVRSLYLKTWASNKYSNDASDISAKLEYAHDFTFTGPQATTAYLNVAGSAKGSVYIHHENTWDQKCNIAVQVGVWDSTHNKEVNSISHGKEASDNGTRQSWSKTLNDQISFTLEPGVGYYVFANVTGAGTNDSGDYDYEIDVTFTQISLTFVNQEFCPNGMTCAGESPATELFENFLAVPANGSQVLGVQ